MKEAAGRISCLPKDNDDIGAHIEAHFRPCHRHNHLPLKPLQFPTHRRLK